MPTKNFFNKAEMLHLGRALMAILALIIAAGHLSFTTPSGFASAPSPTHPYNSTHQAAQAPSPMAFSEITFWFGVEVIAYTLIAVVFLLGLRTWYPLSILFNIFNLGIFYVSRLVAIPGITSMAFGGHITAPIGLNTLNIIAVAWILALIVGLILYKYDPGSELDKLLVTRKSR